MDTRTRTILSHVHHGPSGFFCPAELTWGREAWVHWRARTGVEHVAGGARECVACGVRGGHGTGPGEQKWEGASAGVRSQALPLIGWRLGPGSAEWRAERRNKCLLGSVKPDHMCRTPDPPPPATGTRGRLPAAASSAMLRRRGRGWGVVGSGNSLLALLG
ncbi:hypothetical protein E2C01_100366 [Portunus trituberculatus]|uniref:Uncharacterized protein n=1 Tax=Portunus trituberculatus TaxID=210409 RepID=A0A5B7KHD5_PORTR|nr:hypothetical protein [Portunus trituberculatus]